MPTALFTKVTGGLFVPVGIESEQALERVKVGDVVECTWVLKRNPKFLKKFFALIRVGFDLWEPVLKKCGLRHGEAIQQGRINKWGAPIKNIERYRSDVTITAGYYKSVFDLHGELRLEPKSISFGKMDEEEFAQLYSDVIDIMLRHIPETYSQSDINDAVERIIGFS